MLGLYILGQRPITGFLITTTTPVTSIALGRPINIVGVHNPIILRIESRPLNISVTNEPIRLQSS